MPDMNRNYPRPDRLDIGLSDLAQWANSHETDQVVAAAIHAIADSSRSAEQIWADPTRAEWEHVEMAVYEYLDHGDFERSGDDCYCWGEEMITVEPPPEC